MMVHTYGCWDVQYSYREKNLIAQQITIIIIDNIIKVITAEHEKAKTVARWTRRAVVLRRLLYMVQACLVLMRVNEHFIGIW